MIVDCISIACFVRKTSDESAIFVIHKKYVEI